MIVHQTDRRIGLPELGRLIRTASDQGVVAVFDRRLSRARYGWEIVNGLPPMRRTRDRTEAESFLKSLNK